MYEHPCSICAENIDIFYVLHIKNSPSDINTIPLKGIVSPDWKGLQMISLDRFEV
jgi:hypothetical protein